MTKHDQRLTHSGIKWLLNGGTAWTKSLSLTPFDGPKTAELSEREHSSSSFDRANQMETVQVVYLEGKEIDK